MGGINTYRCVKAIKMGCDIDGRAYEVGKGSVSPYIPIINSREFREFADIAIPLQQREYLLSCRGKVVFAGDYLNSVFIKIKIAQYFILTTLCINGEIVNFFRCAVFVE